MLRRETTSCGCDRAKPPEYLLGRVFGKLTVESFRHKQIGPGRWVYLALCRCGCGSSKEVLTHSLKRGATTSCGCSKERYSKTTGERNRNFKGFKEIRSGFWKGYVNGAHQRGLPFTITMEYAWNLFEEQGRRCALSGVPLSFGTTGKNSNTTASMDRVDNGAGYVPGNIQWVHKRVNLMRNTLSIENFVSWCAQIADYCGSGRVDRDRQSLQRTLDDRLYLRPASSCESRAEPRAMEGPILKSSLPPDIPKTLF